MATGLQLNVNCLSDIMAALLIPSVLGDKSAPIVIYVSISD